MPTNYRPEIDGIRALAVLAVVFYHAEFSIGETPLFSGGFLGVDVFFVISGYLITSILLGDLDANRFSLVRFYERRARRILPVLLVIMLVSMPFAWIYLLPDALTAYAASILASLAFGSNFLFFLEDSYNADPSALKPFLHTWSLSVEEQFYAFYPLLLLFFWRHVRAFLTSFLIAAALLSLNFAQQQSIAAPDAAFFLFPARAWELLAGAVLANMEKVHGRNVVSRLGSFMPMFGLLLIAVSIAYFDEGTRHPSYISSAPVLGTMLLIWFCRADELLTVLLSKRLIVGIGLISYSFYLWHFPIFAFARIDSIMPLKNGEKALLISVALLCSIATFYFVESPARRKELLPRRVFVSLTILLTLLISTCAAALIYFDGVPSRLGSVAQLVDAAKRIPVVKDDKPCDGRPVAETCFFAADRVAPSVINIGDSHARSLGNEMLAMAKRNGLPYRQITQNGCLHIVGTVRWSNGLAIEDCVNRSVELQQFLAKHEPAILIYSGRIPMQLLGSRFDNGEGGVEPGDSPSFRALPDYGESPASLIAATFQSWLEMGHTLVLIYPVPEVGWHVRRKIKQMLDDIPATPIYLRKRALATHPITTDYKLHDARAESTVAILNSLGEHPRLVRIYPSEIFCSRETGRCKTHDDEKLFYEDTNHVSPAGAAMVIARIEKQLAQKKILGDN